jgi:putative tricarboxylic transport membrane protein
MPSSPRVDLFSGFGWIALGSAIVYGSWTMDRLENLNINPYTAPGLVPGVLGAVIALCGGLMAVRAARAGGFRSDGAAREPIFTWRVALSMALCLGFGLGLVGRGPPFWAAAALFLFLHVFLFEFGDRRAGHRLGRGVLVALGVSAGASFVITMIFQEFFLVRLP